MKWIVLLAAVILNASANVLIKAGMRKLGGATLQLETLGRVVTNGYLIAGIGSFGLALIAYSMSLTKFELSVAYPLMTSLGFIIVGLSSYLWFKEELSILKIIGMVIILIGVFLVARESK